MPCQLGCEGHGPLKVVIIEEEDTSARDFYSESLGPTMGGPKIDPPSYYDPDYYGLLKRAPNFRKPPFAGYTCLGLQGWDFKFCQLFHEYDVQPIAAGHKNR